MRPERWLYTIPLRLRSLFRRRGVDQDLDDELAYHLEQQIRQNIARGMSAEEARYAALRALGGMQQVKEQCKERRRVNYIEHFFHDLRYGFRQLRRSPGFTIVAILTLALGIGANTAIFSFIDAVLLKPLPWDHPEQVVRVLEKVPTGNPNGISTMNFLDWKNQNTVFSALAAQASGSMALTGVDVPVQLHGLRVSASFFEIFTTTPILGRTFAPDEDQLGKERVAILSHRIWENQFGSDRSIVGRTISLDKKPYTVIGVLPPESAFDRGYADLWTPLAFEPKDMTRDFHWMGAFGRLKPGVSVEEARAGMKPIVDRIAHDFPHSNKGWSIAIDTFREIMVDSDLRLALLVLLGAVGVVLLIGCANMANLLLARGSQREREIAVRSAIGAGRRRLIRQFFTESILLAFLGGAAGILLGFGLMLGIKASLPPFSLPNEADVHLDARVLLFSVVIIFVTVVLFGLAPAIHGTRVDLANSLKEGTRGAGAGRSRRRLQNGLIVAEVAMAFVLLAGAGLLLRSFHRLQRVDLGFDPTNVLTMDLIMPAEQYPEAPAIISYLDRVMESIRAVPGVRDVAIASGIPLQGWGIGTRFRLDGETVEHRYTHAVGVKIVSPSYFSAIGARLKKGRVLAESDTEGGLPAMVINESAANEFFKGQDALGKHIYIEQFVPGKHQRGPEVPWQIVGVIADEKNDGLRQTTDSGVYLSYKQSPEPGTSLVVRGAIDPDHLLKEIQRAVASVNSNQALDNIKSMEQIKSETLGGDALEALLVGGFAAMALLLAAIGIYGVLSYSVVQRTHEMGIRAALGASTWQQLKLVLGSGLILALIGLTIGTAGAFGVTRLLGSLLFEVSPYDPSTLVGVAVVLAAVAIIACYIPARRATKVDPIIALRYE
ncbi:MAG TPA: ABC transporter permease [Candidatus Angelobacter sp.]